VAFKFVVGTPLLLGLLAFGISRLTVQATLRPLREAAAAITKLKLGDYKVVLNCSGPPEVRRACAAINALAEVLASLQTENRSLMKRLVSAQDDERAEIGRDSPLGQTRTRCKIPMELSSWRRLRQHYRALSKQFKRQMDVYSRGCVH
jgi:signal transduction histidine kinase